MIHCVASPVYIYMYMYEWMYLWPCYWSLKDKPNQYAQTFLIKKLSVTGSPYLLPNSGIPLDEKPKCVRSDRKGESLCSPYVRLEAFGLDQK